MLLFSEDNLGLAFRSDGCCMGIGSSGLNIGQELTYKICQYYGISQALE